MPSASALILKIKVYSIGSRGTTSKAEKKIHEQIDEAIGFYDRLLLILTETSMNSEWLKTEIAKARRREAKEKRQMLFPISLVPFEKIREWKAFDADTGKDSPVRSVNTSSSISPTGKTPTATSRRFRGC